MFNPTLRRERMLLSLMVIILVVLLVGVSGSWVAIQEGLAPAFAVQIALPMSHTLLIAHGSGCSPNEIALGCHYRINTPRHFVISLATTHREYHLVTAYLAPSAHP